ncbi:MAG: alpha-galactosidase [Clostridia bacterium]|nr:alpha-galactosidase [Clostridia bacterium]
MSIQFDQNSMSFHLSNSRISYIFRLAAGKYPLHVHWGRKVRNVADKLITRRTIWTEETFSLNETSLDFLPVECPTFAGDLREGMIHVIHENGMSALLLEYESHQIISGKPALAQLPSARGEQAQSLLLTLRDRVSGVAVELCYTVYEDVDIIARSARIINGGNTAITVDKALSACVDFERSDFNLITLSGAWVRERQMYTRPLVPGDQGTSSVRGASSVQTSPFMALVSPDATEEHGDAYGFALCYSGGFEASVHVDQHFIARAQIGIQPFNFSWKLAPGESFQTPEAYLCYSCEGLGGMSRQFHKHIHSHITTGKYAHSTRPILINNWEATYFDFNEEKLLKLAGVARQADIDLFVLDDGWFGHRDADNSSLGDWFDDLRKLPDGLSSLSEKIHALGLKFGLWVEPEMISVDSELYKAHPDWCIHVPGYPRIEYRNQLVLDLSRDEVRDYVVDVIIAALRRANVDYVKWDMNRFINMWGSAALPADRQQELGHRYILGVYDMMRRITSAFPDVLFESCAGGGGRFDLGMMCFMPQAWCTDDTDAWMRCRIQHSTSLVFPPSTMGAHVSAVPNHQTGRFAPLSTRAAVAMSGTYGYELDLTKLPCEEIEEIRALNKRLRELQPLLLYGTYYRLRSPYAGNEAAWMSVSDDKREAIVTHVYAQAVPNMKQQLMRLTGLDPALIYRDTDTGLTYGGDELMYYGIALRKSWGDYMSEQFHLVAID